MKKIIRKILREQVIGDNELNQPLRNGDTIMVVELSDNMPISVLGWKTIRPSTFKPYRVRRMVFRQRENWEGPNTDTRVFLLRDMDNDYDHMLSPKDVWFHYEPKL